MKKKDILNSARSVLKALPDNGATVARYRLTRLIDKIEFHLGIENDYTEILAGENKLHDVIRKALEKANLPDDHRSIHSVLNVKGSFIGSTQSEKEYFLKQFQKYRIKHSKKLSQRMKTQADKIEQHVTKSIEIDRQNTTDEDC